jgi:hypothetical protein
MLTRWLDLLERTAWTAIQAFAASVVVTGNVGAADLKIAGLASAIAAAKSLSIATTVRTGEELIAPAAKKKRP